MHAVDKACQIVREGILIGRYAAAARITEQEIAVAAGVSRTPVREALRRLHAEGLVEFAPHQGAVVTTWTDADSDEIFDLARSLNPTARSGPHSARRVQFRGDRRRQLAISPQALRGSRQPSAWKGLVISG